MMKRKRELRLLGALVTVIVLAMTFLLMVDVEAGDVNEKDDNGRVTIFFVKEGTTKEVDKVVKTDEEWKKILSDKEFEITRKKGTERAFTGRYYDSKEKGVYKCVACGTDLFSSKDKYDSGTGWPSFYRPVSEHNIRTETDKSLFMTRTEVLCARCGSHQGHVFDDGPAPTYKRYCINSAALEFEAE